MDLIAFARASDHDSTIQASLSAAELPQVIIQIAQENGFSITLSQLKQAVPDLSAFYWPWSGKGFRFRSQFFRG